MMEEKTRVKETVEVGCNISCDVYYSKKYIKRSEVHEHSFFFSVQLLDRLHTMMKATKR